MAPRIPALAALLPLLLLACQDTPTTPVLDDPPSERPATTAPSFDFAVLESPLSNRCGHQLTGVAWDGTYYYVAEGQFGADQCIIRYTAGGQYVDQRLISIDMRGLHYVPATGKLVTRRYNGGFFEVDYTAGTWTQLTSYAPAPEQIAAAPDPEGGSFWLPVPGGVQQRRLSDNVALRSFAVTHANAFSIGVSDRWVYVVDGTTIRIYSKRTGLQVATRTLSAGLGCQGWGFGVSASGDRILYVRSCGEATAEPTNMGGKGLTASCGHQLTGAAWDGTHYYVAEGQFGLDNCISRFTADSRYVDQRMVSIDMRGLHYVPATGKLVTRHYNGVLWAVDYAAGTWTQLNSFQPADEQFAPAPDPDGTTYWAIAAGAATQRRLSDNVLLRSIPAAANNPYVIGVSDRWVYTVNTTASGSTVHIYSKLTGNLVATRALNGGLGCQGWGFGASANGDRLLSVANCGTSSAQLTGLGGKGLAAVCGRQLTGVAWDGSSYYVAEGQFGLNQCITRYSPDSMYLDQRMVTIDMRGLHYVPASGKLVTRHYNGALWAVDYAAGTWSPLTPFGAGPEQYAPAPDPQGGTFWILNGQNVEQRRLSDNVLLRSFPVTHNDPYVLAVTDQSVLTLESTTVHVYDKATGVHVGTRSLNGSLGCQGWGFGAGAAGDRLLYVRNCSLASAEAVSLPMPGTTPAGTDVAVQPLDTETGQPSPIEVSFASVASAGVTTVTALPLGGTSSPPPPDGYRIASEMTYYDIETTANFSGTVTVCLRYSTAGVSDESSIRLLHGNPDGSWTNITTSRDEEADVVCGEVASLSPFLVAELKQAQAITFEPLADRLLDSPPFALEGSASSGLPIAFALGAGSVGCSLSGTTATITGITPEGSGCVVVATQAGDADYAAAEPVTRTFRIGYPFTGFFEPVNNPGATAPYLVNGVKAGRTIPVKFSLAGNRGLGILAAGSPSSTVSSACSGGTTDAIEETVAASSSGLTYDTTAEQYVYTWKTESSWAGHCRKLTVRLVDGSRYEALFRFVK